MIIPLGADPAAQDLALIEKDQGGALSEQRLFPVAFVPLTGGNQGVSGGSRGCR